MDEIKLTKDADVLICTLYKAYLQRRKNKQSKSEARVMGSSEVIREDLLPKWQFEDVDDTCRELSRAGLLSCSYGDDTVCFSELSDSGIAYMEQRFKTGLSAVLDYIEAIAAFIPW